MEPQLKKARTELTAVAVNKNSSNSDKEVINSNITSPESTKRYKEESTSRPLSEIRPLQMPFRK